MKIKFIMMIRITLISFMSIVFFATSGLSENLRLLSSWPQNTDFVEGSINSFSKNLKNQSHDNLEIQFSGPSIVPTLEQLQPLQAGVFDLLYTMSHYHLGTTTIGVVVDTMKSDPVKRRESGIFDYIDKEYNKIGVKVVAIFSICDLHFLTREPLEGRNPSFAGLKLRTTPTAVPLVKAFGGSPVNLAAGEVYTSLQKGVIDGTIVMTYGAWNYKWHEVTQYMTRPTFGHLSSYLLMNLNKYKNLSPSDKNAIDDAGKLTEIEAYSYFKKKRAEVLQKYLDYGLKETHLKASEGKKMNLIVNKTFWAFAIGKSGDAARKLQALAVKTGMLR